MMIMDKIEIAADSARVIDSNGYLHVAKSNITKAQVVPYVGNTLPGWQENGLEPQKIYHIYRPAEEISKAVDSFNGLPLALDHWEMDAENMPKDKIVGSLGTDAAFDAPYLTNSLIITDAEAIRAIERGDRAELSAAYSCDVEMTGGIFDGQSYDGRMKNIRGNHVALVREGRAGHDVRVADAAAGGGENMNDNAWKTLFFNLADALKGGDTVNDNKDVILATDEAVKGDEPEKKADPNTSPATEEDCKAKDCDPKKADDEAVKEEEEVKAEVTEDAAEAMKSAGLNCQDAAIAKAFLAGVEHGKKSAPAQTAADAAPAFSKADAAALYTAAEEVAPHVGKINNPFAFDSAADIYKKALDAKGVNVEGVDPSAYGAMVKMLQTAPAVATDAAPAKPDPLNDALAAIRSR